MGAVFVLSCSLLLVRCRARLNARVERGALNAGRAWIPGGGVVDGFWAESGFPVFWGCASRAFPFCRSPVIWEQCRHKPEIALLFYNLTNIPLAGPLGRGEW